MVKVLISLSDGEIGTKRIREVVEIPERKTTRNFFYMNDKIRF